jgi:DNA gyrase inhibitor GyrI
MPLVQQLDRQQIREFLGLSGIDKTKVGLRHRAIKSGKYARFVLTGPYAQIWTAFDTMFKRLAEQKVELRPEFCIENYVNDPQVTPEDQLKTELLIPVR